MFKTLYYPGLLILLFISISCTAQVMPCIWMPHGAVVDGKYNEWPKYFDNYDPSTKTQFALANDSTHLFVCLKVDEEATQFRVLHHGVELWFDLRGKKAKKVGVNFPMKMERNPEDMEMQKRREQAIPGQEPIRNGERMKMKQRLRMRQSNLSAVGMVGIPAQLLPLKNDFNISAAMDWDSNGVLCLEYAIPFSALMPQPISASDTLKAFSLAIVEPAPEAPPKSEQNTNSPPMNSGMRSPSGMGSGQGNMGQGGMGQGGMGQTGGGHYSAGTATALPTEQKIWLKFSPAFH